MVIFVLVKVDFSIVSVIFWFIVGVLGLIVFGIGGIKFCVVVFGGD